MTPLATFGIFFPMIPKLTLTHVEHNFEHTNNPSNRRKAVFLCPHFLAGFFICGVIVINNLNQEAILEGIRAVPPVLFTAAWFHGITINDVVAMATLGYVLLQIGLLIPKYVRFFRDRKSK